MDHRKKLVAQVGNSLRADDDEITRSTASSEPRRPHLYVLCGTPVTDNSGAGKSPILVPDSLPRGRKRRRRSPDAEVIPHLRSV